MSFSLLLFTITFFSPLLTNAHFCTQEFSTEIKNKFKTTPNCHKKTLGAEFGWVFDNKTRQLDIAFGAKLNSETGWLAWGLNPHGPHMIGTRALIGIKHPNDSLEWHQYNITEATKHGCPLSASDDVGLNVTRFKLDYMEKIEYYVILAAIFLPYEYNSLATNVVWQIGDKASESQPLMHPKSLYNFNSAETLNLVYGNHTRFKAHQSRRLRLAHGIMNIVGWGTLLPTGVIVARYFKVFPLPWRGWFLFHVTCQTTGYIIGSLGWALGIWLGATSKYYNFHTHHVFGVIIFTFTTIQMLAIRLRLSKKDKHRIYWNIYHHFLGYALLILIWVNIFMGIHILEPGRELKWVYLGILGALGLVALAFELYSWIKFLIQIKNKKDQKTSQGDSLTTTKLMVRQSPTVVGSAGQNEHNYLECTRSRG